MTEDLWLINAPRGKKRSRRRTTSSRRKRRPPKGFRTWKAYMASISPNSRGGVTVARRRRRRRRSATAAAPRRRRRRRYVRRNAGLGFPNPRRRHARRRYRRNPSFLKGGRGILGKVTGTAIAAVQVVGGKIAVRYVRGLIGIDAASATAPLAELAIATGIGVFGGRFLGQSVAQYLMLGGFIGVTESMLKRLPANPLTATLGDDGDPAVVRVPISALRRMAGYPNQRRLMSGYPDPGTRRARLQGFPTVTRPGSVVPELNDVMG